MDPLLIKKKKKNYGRLEKLQIYSQVKKYYGHFFPIKHRSHQSATLSNRTQRSQHTLQAWCQCCSGSNQWLPAWRLSHVQLSLLMWRQYFILLGPESECSNLWCTSALGGSTTPPTSPFPTFDNYSGFLAQMDLNFLICMVSHQRP